MATFDACYEFQWFLLDTKIKEEGDILYGYIQSAIGVIRAHRDGEEIRVHHATAHRSKHYAQRSMFKDPICNNIQ